MVGERKERDGNIGGGMYLVAFDLIAAIGLVSLSRRRWWEDSCLLWLGGGLGSGAMYFALTGDLLTPWIYLTGLALIGGAIRSVLEIRVLPK